MMPVPDLSRMAIILVEPQQPGNVGAVCRAMANFGVTDLRLVNPCIYRHSEAARMAVFARPLLGQAQTFNSLQQAVEGLAFSAAFTRRPGFRRGELQSLAELPSILSGLPENAEAGLVFGREDNGLTTEEAASCNLSVCIPTTHQQGSLNLAQAVVVALYELSRVSRVQV